MPRSDAPPGQRRRTCLVAVDGTRSGVEALVWGLRHAAAQDMDVEVLTVWPAHHSVLIHEVPGHFCAHRWSARVAQENTVREAIDAVPAPPPVTTTLENGDVAEVIVRASNHHDLVVLGSRRAQEHHRLTDRVIRDTTCDVVVIKPTSFPGEPGADKHQAARHSRGAPS